jgi:hypothetical protein
MSSVEQGMAEFQRLLRRDLEAQRRGNVVDTGIDRDNQAAVAETREVGKTRLERDAPSIGSLAAGGWSGNTISARLDGESLAPTQPAEVFQPQPVESVQPAVQPAPGPAPSTGKYSF